MILEMHICKRSDLSPCSFGFVVFLSSKLKNEDLKLKNEEYKAKIPSTFADRIFALVDTRGLEPLTSCV